MQRKKLFFGVGAISVLIVLIVGMTLLSKSVVAPTERSRGTCGIENCHGLEVTCGWNPVQTCTAMYELGDRCRKFVSCQAQYGECNLISTLAFDRCKTCVEECDTHYHDDAIKLFRCEGTCANFQ